MGNTAPSNPQGPSRQGLPSRVLSPQAQALENEFAKHASNDILNRASFHKALEVLETMGLKRLRETPLADLLFDAFAENDMMNSQNFRSAMQSILSQSPATRLTTSFRAIAGSHNETFPTARLLDFFERSWIVATQTIAGKLHLTKHGNVADLVKVFGTENTSALHQTLRSHFGESVSRADFAKFFAENRDIKVVAKDLSVEVPSSFLYLEIRPQQVR